MTAVHKDKLFDGRTLYAAHGYEVVPRLLWDHVNMPDIVRRSEPSVSLRRKLRRLVVKAEGGTHSCNEASHSFREVVKIWVDFCSDFVVSWPYCSAKQF
jgi:hypothetical protein